MTMTQCFYRALRRQGIDKAAAREAALNFAEVARQPISEATLRE